MFKSILILLTVLSFFLFSCKKKKGDKLFNVTYQVDVFVTDTLHLSYYSDHHFASNVTEYIYPLDANNHNLYLDNTVWLGTRTTANKEEGYYIKVGYGELNVPTGATFGVRVYANDTILIDSKVGDANTKTIIVEGKIPAFFK